MGFALGVRIRMKVLLPILLLLLFASIILSITRGLSVVDAVLMVFLVQAIVQWAYFLGLVARGAFAVIRRQPRPQGKVLQRREGIDGDASVEAAQLKGID
ncbi:MAG TPA: hypothetical protein VMM15_10155 [Bradyrhizobium sp.]|nr:hypothetical protein [Bradyrhizobium sp.]